MHRRLTGKRILVTGASSGIGYALAVEAAREGMKLILSGLEGDRLATLAEQLHRSGTEVVAIASDLTSARARQALFDTAVAAYGGLDVLVNNAGVGAFGHFVDLPAETLRQIMEVNFFACAENCRLAVRLLAQGEQPLIVNISSMYGRRGMPGWAAYCASKFALCGFSEALRAELARYAIDLMLVLPGVTDTNFSRNLIGTGGESRIDLGTGMPPEVVARRILTGMRANRTALTIGRDAHRLTWATRLVPRLVDFITKRSVLKQYESRRTGTSK